MNRHRRKGWHLSLKWIYLIKVMSNTFEKTMLIPDLINIEFKDKNNAPFYKENILIGIKTHAYHKNDINIFPFVSDKNGHLRITKKEINKQADEFISYGLMDYSSLGYAKPNVELYFWGNKGIRIYLGYETDHVVLQNLKTYIPNFNEEDFKKQRIEQRKQDDNYLIFEQCYNRTTNIEEDIILATDLWDKEKKEVFYKVTLPL
jgi:hypothetical protein